MLSTKKYEEAKELIDEIERHNAEANGALRQSMKTLRKFKCKTVKEGQRLKKKLQKQLAKHDKELDKVFKVLRKKARKRIAKFKKRNQ